MERGNKSRRIQILAVTIALLGQPLLCLAAEGETHEDGEASLAPGKVESQGTELSAEHGTGAASPSGPSAFTRAAAAATAQFADTYQRPVAIQFPDPLRERSAGNGNELFTLMGVSMFAASAGDLVTTEMGLRRDGIYESNPVQTNRWARVSTHVAVPALVWWMTDRAHDRGKTKLALLMRVGFSVAYGYVTLHNARRIGSVQ